MNIKTMTAVVATAATGLVHAATPQVTSVSMAQSSSSRLVTIDYTFTGEDAVITLDVQTNAPGGAWASIGGAAVCNAQGEVWKKVSNDGSTHHITWRPDLSWPDHVIADGGARAVITAWTLDNTPDYMVVDVSEAAQPNTQRYYPSADSVPGGVSNGLYKTTTVLMRKIMAKDVMWTMGSTSLESLGRIADREATHQVSLTNNYYIGVYEVTQSQWSQVATNSSIAANFTVERFMRPMESVCYNEIRLKANSNAEATAAEIADYSWPKDPNPSSFLGLLRLKTGIDFDLPSEAQWEFAARAGNGVGYWNNGSAMQNAASDNNLNPLGRYAGNSASSPTGSAAPSVGGTAISGSYVQSAWGIYDMHGNVQEFCLDWNENDITAHGGKVNIDPADPAKTLSGVAGSQRVARGGSYALGAHYCRPAYRGNNTPTQRNTNIGFRVVCTAGLR